MVFRKHNSIVIIGWNERAKHLIEILTANAFFKTII